MTKFTPGPWFYKEGHWFEIMDEKNENVLFETLNIQNSSDYEEHLANVRLVAKAPELYALLKGYLDGKKDETAAHRLICDIEGIQ